MNAKRIINHLLSTTKAVWYLHFPSLEWHAFISAYNQVSRYQGLFACDRSIDPSSLHTASLGSAAQATKEKNISLSRAKVHLFTWRKCQGVGYKSKKKKKKRLKTTALGQGSHVCILSLAKHTKVSMHERVCVRVHYTWTHSFSISMFVQMAHSFHINWEFQSKLLSRKVQCDLLLFHAHRKEAAGIFAF